MKKDYRNTLILTWAICYVVILICYLSRIGSGDNPNLNTFSRLFFLFGLISAILVPQIGLMLSFYFERSNEEIAKIISERQNAKLAYWFSFFYIIAFAILIILGIAFEILFSWKINEATYNIIVIMGHLALFMTLPIKYLFR